MHSWPWSLRCSVVSALCTLPPPSLFGFVRPPSPLCPHSVGESCAYPLSTPPGYESAHLTVSTPQSGLRPPAFPRAQSSPLSAHPKPSGVFIYPLPTPASRTAQHRAGAPCIPGCSPPDHLFLQHREMPFILEAWVGWEIV